MEDPTETLMRLTALMEELQANADDGPEALWAWATAERHLIDAVVEEAQNLLPLDLTTDEGQERFLDEAEAMAEQGYDVKVAR